MKFKSITIEDKETFDKFLKEFQPQQSELTFTNLFCWRITKKTEFVISNNHLIISFEENGEKFFYEPIGLDPVSTIYELKKEHPEFNESTRQNRLTFD